MPLGSAISSLCTCDSELASLDTHLLEVLGAQRSSYTGVERTMGNLSGTTYHLMRIRELLTLGAGGADNLLINNLRDFNRLQFEYQLHRDINGDSKIYGWDYVHVDDEVTLDIEPQPILRGIAMIPEVADKILNGRIEVIPTNMPDTGDYNGPMAGIFGFISGDIKGDYDYKVVSLALAGPAAKTTLSFAASGGYHFVGLTVTGTYTITPVLDGYTFTPASQTVEVTAGTLGSVPPNITGVNFVAAVA